MSNEELHREMMESYGKADNEWMQKTSKELELRALYNALERIEVLCMRDMKESTVEYPPSSRMFDIMKILYEFGFCLDWFQPEKENNNES